MSKYIITTELKITREWQSGYIELYYMKSQFIKHLEYSFHFHHHNK